MKKAAYIASAFALPLLASAQFATVNSFLDKVKGEIIDPIITLLALGAFVVFVWGTVEFIRNAADDEKRGDGKKHMLWGIVGLAIIFGAQAILALMASVFGLTVPK